ncbi:hypothetical protein IMZ48_42445 [Candidatus Bathyarchaeota archaeon]|nr:hypothetical protein [Candidatus Bathyarchaeota archaeon]
MQGNPRGADLETATERWHGWIGWIGEWSTPELPGYPPSERRRDAVSASIGKLPSWVRPPIRRQGRIVRFK